MSCPDFDGETYDRDRDRPRLASLLARVESFMVLHQNRWLTKQEILAGVGHDDWASVSARLRDLRKGKFGGRDIERSSVSGGVWVYRLRVGQGRLW